MSQTTATSAYRYVSGGGSILFEGAIYWCHGAYPGEMVEVRKAQSASQVSVSPAQSGHARPASTRGSARRFRMLQYRCPLQNKKRRLDTENTQNTTAATASCPPRVYLEWRNVRIVRNDVSVCCPVFHTSFPRFRLEGYGPWASCDHRMDNYKPIRS